MPRAHRHYIPGCLWHITHRCHKKEFLLKFGRDRDRWLHWLFEAKKRYNSCILNYTVTSNHIHLLVLDNGSRDVIPRSLQLVAGRSGQEYNQRKNRKGAFWEDRYHATAVEKGDHLIRCLTYIDLNMVRAGVVAHPSEWLWSGYNEIQQPRQRYTLIDQEKLRELLGFHDYNTFAAHHRQWVNDALNKNTHIRESRWTESVAVGSRTFIEETQQQLGFRAKGRKISEDEETFELREESEEYDSVGENSRLRLKNTYLWQDIG